MHSVLCTRPRAMARARYPANMTVTVTTAYSGPFTPNGVATVFGFDFKAASADEVAVVLVETDTAISNGLFTVALDASGEGGSVSFTLPPAAGTSDFLIVSEPGFQQQGTFTGGERPFTPGAINRLLDEGAVRDIALREGVRRAIQLPVGEEAPTLPPRSLRVGGRKKLLAFNQSTGDIQVEEAGSTFQGDPGPADNTYTTLAALLASDPARKSARLVPEAGETAAAGNFSYIDGEWVRQEAAGIQAKVAATAQEQDLQRILWQLDTISSAAFGVQAGVTQDQAPAINAAMAAGIAGKKRVIHPAGTIYVGSPLTVGSNYFFVQEGPAGSGFQHMAGVTTPMFVREPGVVTRVALDINARGNGLPGEIGFYMDDSPVQNGQGVPVAPFHGGVWYGSVRGRWQNWGRKAHWWRGGAAIVQGQSASDTPAVFHQFIDLSGLEVDRIAHDSRGVVLTGLCGQFNFGTGCEINGSTDGGFPDGWNLVVSRQFFNPNLSGLAAYGSAPDALNLDGTFKPGWQLSLSGNGVTDTAGYAINFHSTASLQFSPGGAWIDRATMKFDRAYLEGLYNVFHVTGSGTLFPDNCEFANVAYRPGNPSDVSGVLFGQATGYIGGSDNNIFGYFLGIYHKRYGSGTFEVVARGVGVIDAAGNARVPYLLGSETCVPVSPAANVLPTGLNTDLYVNLDNGGFHSLDTGLGIGARITLRGGPAAGANTTTRIIPGGNISSGETQVGGSLVLRSMDSVTLLVSDTWGTMIVVDKAIAPLASPVMPSAGFFYAGEFVRNTSAFTSGSIVLGWQRLTDGAGHVAGTDWRVVQATGA